MRFNQVVRTRSALTALAVVALVTGAVQAEAVYGVTQTGFLVRWDSATPGTIQSGVAIQGLQNNESLVGIDFRPLTGELYGVGSFSRAYKINPTTGVASALTANPFTPALNGGSFGMDFNPRADRIRLDSDADQNLRAHPVTGLVAVVDPMLVYAGSDVNAGVNPNISHVAYNNNFSSTLTTRLFGLDTGTDMLVELTGSPQFNVANTIGPMGADVTEVGGFDISGDSGIAYATIKDVALARSTFWTINLLTGQGSMIGEIGGGHTITAMAVFPEPAAMTLLSLAGLLYVRRR